ncbi:DUF6491 family protein [Spongiibacter taiwanensis]|uniref:DUF6491 family protein n=1 Tax=Spongiibacter taiwanensis TaxID=1748242 RepID=UPI0020358096|nr:DUF6491 family protein [Spongiibacter taiwanensis]USA43728.1 DUF6491 family protein [Spongiibacter taiwanensis]
MRVIGITAAALITAASSVALADNNAADKKPDPVMEATKTMATGEAERCLGITRIREMKVLDNRNILFYTRPDQVYLNTLDRACGGLTRFKAVTYKTSLHELCNVDIITVIDDVGGSFMRGASCGLGEFYPISAEDADTLYKASRE